MKTDIGLHGKTKVDNLIGKPFIWKSYYKADPRKGIFLNATIYGEERVVLIESFDTGGERLSSIKVHGEIPPMLKTCSSCYVIGIDQTLEGTFGRPSIVTLISNSYIPFL